MTSKTRREFLRDATGAMVGVAVTVAVAPTVAEAVLQANPAAVEVGEVLRQSGNGVYVSGRSDAIPIQGFPAGWQLRPGDQVALVRRETTGIVTAMPIVSWQEVQLDPSAVHLGETLTANHKQYDLPAESVVDLGTGPTRVDRRFHVATIYQTDHAREPVIVAIRPVLRTT